MSSNSGAKSQGSSLEGNHIRVDNLDEHRVLHPTLMSVVVVMMEDSRRKKCGEQPILYYSPKSESDKPIPAITH